MFLADTEEPKELRRILLKDVFRFGKESFASSGEIVEFIFFADRLEPLSEAGFFGDGPTEERDLEDRLSVLVNVTGMNVVVAHQGFDTAQDRLLRIFERLGDLSLEAKGEDVIAFSGAVVEVVSDAVDEVESGL